MELSETTWREIQGMIMSEQNKLTKQGINASFAHWQAVYAVASQLDPPVGMPELQLFISRMMSQAKEEKGNPMQQESPYQVEVVEVEDMPRRAFGQMKGRWEWLRALLFAMQPDGKPFKILMPNKREANLASSSAQNIVCTPGKEKRNKKCGRLLPKTLMVATAMEPVVKAKKDGEYYLYVRVVTRAAKSAD